MAESPSVSDSVVKAQQQVSRLAEDIARLSLTDLATSDYYLQFLERILLALAAPAGFIWVRTEQGNFQQQCQHNPGSLDLELSGTARVLRDEVLRQAIQQAKPIYLPPKDSAESPTDSATANPSPWAMLLAPILLNQQVEGVVEVWQNPQRDPTVIPSMMQFLVRMTDLATISLVYRQQRKHHEVQQQIGDQLDAFAQRIHGSLNPTEVGYLLANEGRILVGCDRLSVAVRRGRQARIEAISGVDTVDQRSNLVRRMRRLCDRVLDWGEKLVYRGVPDASLPPEVLRDLDAYLEEGHSKLLVVFPLHDEREKKVYAKPRSALVMECFESAAPPEMLEGRLTEIAKHATTALYNASSHRAIPLRFLWHPVARVQEGLGGKTKAIVASIATALLTLIIVLVFVPYPLKMDAKGQLLPEERRWVYSPVEGQVVRFEEGVQPGSLVAESQHLILMFDVQLEHKLVQLQGEIAAAQQDIAALNKQLNAAATEQDRLRFSADKQQKESLRDRKTWELRALRERTRSDPSRPGNFWIEAPRRGTILSFDFKEPLTNRQVKPSEPLLRIGDKEQRWEIELKIPQKHMGHILRGFPGDDPQAELDVDLLVISAPTRTFKGKLARFKLAAEANPNKEDANEAEPVVLALVRIDGPGIAAEERIPQELLIVGTEVHSKIRCDNRAMGYSLFHGLWEFFYEKVVFFF